MEVYLLDFEGDLYGKTLRLHLVARLREERKYPTLDALKAQIARDVDEVRASDRGARRTGRWGRSGEREPRGQSKRRYTALPE